MRKLVPLLSFLLLVALPAIASAFCGFYVAGGDAKLFNDATQVALVRDGTRTVLSMQNSYEGPPEAFAMVVPVPQVLDESNVKTLEKEVFDRLDKMTAPRLVEYWEKSPCRYSAWTLWDLLSGSLDDEHMMVAGMEEMVSSEFEHGVEIESKFAVGEYDVVVLSANDSAGLDGYLRAENYNIPKGAEPYLRPYVAQGSYFFVARVDPKRATFDDGRAVLSPLRFEYDTETFQLPIRLGMINSEGEQDLVVYTVGKNQRYEVANYPNVLIPTNIEVEQSVKESFGEFYQSLFAATLKKHPKAVITEYAWQFAKCDPCPSEPLGAAEMVALGTIEDGDPGRTAASEWTVTRLHARYAPDAIGEDLVFRAAPIIVGGRERRGEGGALEAAGVGEASEVNQFQGRYIMRNRWFGPITCFVPEFGRWGGPPKNSKTPTSRFLESPNTKGIQPPAVTNEVTRWLAQGVAELDIPGSQPKPFTANWFTFILGYAITMFLLVAVLFGLRLLRRRSTAAFVVVSVFLVLGCCGAMIAGDFVCVLWGLGATAIIWEGLRERRAAKAQDDVGESLP